MSERFDPLEGGLNPRAMIWRCAMDNYEPVARREEAGTATEYDAHDDIGRGIRLEEGSQNFKTRAIFLIDDGSSVRPYYVAAWHDGRPSAWHSSECPPFVIIHPMPTGPTFDLWRLGPRTAYHLKVEYR